ncbi:MAG: LysM peptidoglycan-binding domain-containing protein [Ignavibacteriaceae bacterium]|jgi:nucleoid-associated protein YgaU
MKLNKIWFLSVLLFVAFTFSSFAQEEMTKEEWQNQITKLTAQKESLQKEKQSLETEISGLQTNLQKLTSDVNTCNDELKKMVASSSNNSAEIDNYRKAVNELMGKIQRKDGDKEELTKELEALQASKISASPEFYNQVNKQGPTLLDKWVEAPKEVNYTVVKGDCLWKIAKKKEHYGNGFAWTKIYQANRDQIKNPNLIFPKQTFKIPNLTEEEKAKYEKLKLNYKPAPTPVAAPVTK